MDIERIEVKARLAAFLEMKLKEDWMDQSDFEKVIEAVLSGSGKTIDTLVDSIYVGVNNGFSIDDQFKILDKLKF